MQKEGWHETARVGARPPVTYYSEIEHVNQMGRPMAGEPLGGEADPGARWRSHEQACPRRSVASNAVDSVLASAELLTELSLVRGGDGLLLAGAMFGSVPLEVVGPGEGLAAVLALVGPLSVVHPDVLGQLRGGAEGPAALCAEEALLPGVDLLVPLQRGGAGEGLAALRAGKGPLAGVDALVAHEARGLREGHAAVGALEGPPAAVQRLVLNQVGGLGEALAAGGTGEGPLAGVHALVLQHPAGHRELPVAGGAAEGLLAQVRALVAQQRQRLVEGQAALGAREGLVVAVHVALVFAEVGGAHEGLPAVRARVGFLASVGADVFAVVRGPGVGLVAEGAPVGPLARVQASVLLERAPVGVGLRAQLARVRLGASRLRGARRVPGLLEGPPTLQAPVGRLPLPARPRRTLVLTSGPRLGDAKGRAAVWGRVYTSPGTAVLSGTQEAGRAPQACVEVCRGVSNVTCR